MLNFKNKVYGFTNENLNSYLSLYNFDNAKVLSVIGSGDQYFTSILGGAKEVELFDINKNTWNYFVFKYVAILVLSYEEFIRFFIEMKGYDNTILLKIMEYLPYYEKKELECQLGPMFSISSLWLDSFVDCAKKINFIPYLSEENYYKLQGILRQRALPKFYHESLENLYQKVEKKVYDVMLASNIFQWVNLDEKEYYDLMLRYNSYVIQANYGFNVVDDSVSEDKIFEVRNRINERLIKVGFSPSFVPSITCNQKKDVVYSLRRTKI